MTPPTPRALALLVTLVPLLAALAHPAPAIADVGWRWPVEGELVTHYRNGDDPYAAGQHRGIDIAAPAGTPVVAASAGTLRYAGLAGDSGLTVSIRTADGRFDTSYLHLGSIDVRAGDAVQAGEALGTVGTTGRGSTAEPHLHFGVHDAGERHAYRDPLTFLPPPPREPRAPRAVPVAAPEPLAPAAEPAPLRLVAAAEAGPLPAAPPLPVPTPDPLLAAHALVAPAASSPRAAAPRLTAPAASPMAAAPSLTERADASRSAAPSRLGAPAGAVPASAASQTPSGPARQGAPGPVHKAAARHPEHTRAPLDLGAPPAATAAVAPALQPRTRTTAPPRLAARRHTEPGLDLGWLAACAGLVAAAALLGRPRGPAASLRAAREVVTHAGGPGPADSIAAWPTTSPRRSTT